MYELPKRKHLVHKAIEPRNLSAKAATVVASRKPADEYWEIKYDGCMTILVKAGGKAYAFSRQGEPVAGAMDRQLAALEAVAMDDFVVFAEAWSPNLIHSDINGDFRRGHKLGDERRLIAVMFDMVTLQEFNEGKTDGHPSNTFEYRTLDLINLLQQLIDVGTEKANLFDLAVQRDTKEECANVVELRRSQGQIFPIDGFMRKAKNGYWVAGAGACGSSLKDKELLVVDLEVTGLVEGEGKFTGMLGAYDCLYKGKPQRVGGGSLKDSERKAIWADKTRAEGGIGSIIEVHALAESTNGLLREPRFARFRTDKKEGE